MAKHKTNDAELCRLKGFVPGDYLCTTYMTDLGQESFKTYVRLTAIGERAILVRILNRGGHSEQAWCQKLQRYMFTKIAVDELPDYAREKITN